MARDDDRGRVAGERGADVPGSRPARRSRARSGRRSRSCPAGCRAWPRRRAGGTGRCRARRAGCRGGRAARRRARPGFPRSRRGRSPARPSRIGKRKQPAGRRAGQQDAGDPGVAPADAAASEGRVEGEQRSVRRHAGRNPAEAVPVAVVRSGLARNALDRPGGRPVRRQVGQDLADHRRELEAVARAGRRERDARRRRVAVDDERLVRACSCRGRPVAPASGPSAAGIRRRRNARTRSTSSAADRAIDRRPGRRTCPSGGSTTFSPSSGSCGMP